MGNVCYILKHSMVTKFPTDKSDVGIKSIWCFLPLKLHFSTMNNGQSIYYNDRLLFYLMQLFPLTDPISLSNALEGPSIIKKLLGKKKQKYNPQTLSKSTQIDRVIVIKSECFTTRFIK